MLKNTRKGFTLVELIVVIVILATLATVAFITLQDYPIQARDSKRTQDVSSISQKMSTELANGQIALSKLLETTGKFDVSITGTNGETYTGAYGKVNYDTIKEAKESFSDPTSKEGYYALFIKGGSGTGMVRCFEVATLKELDNTVFVKGNCNTFNILSTADENNLFSKVVDSGNLYDKLKTNIEPK